MRGMSPHGTVFRDRVAARSRRSEGPTNPRESGVALVITLLILTILIVIVFQLSYTTKVNLRLAKNRLDGTVLEYAFLGALTRAKEYISADARENEWDGPTDSWATVSLSADEGLEEYDYARDPWYDGEEGGDAESRVELEVAIIDEDRKLNISLLRPRPANDRNQRDERDRNRSGDNRNRDDSGQPREREQREPTNRLAEEKIRERVFDGLISILAEFREGTPYALTGTDARDIAESIRDYIVRPTRRNAPDDEIPTPQTEDYPLLTVDELLLIPGVTEDLLYDFEDPDQPSFIVPGLLHFVTVWSSGLVNVNTAPEIVLRALFEPDNRDRAADIVEYRDSGEEEQDRDSDRDRDSRDEDRDRDRDRRSSRDRDEDEEESAGIFKQVSELQNSVLDNESYQEILPFITTRSTVFSVHVTGKRGKVTVHKRVVYRRIGAEVYPLFQEERRDRLLWGRESEMEMSGQDDFLF
jgi:type II secretory pathway component PulK